MNTGSVEARPDDATQTGVPFVALTEATRTAADVSSNAAWRTARAVSAWFAARWREYQVQRTMSALAQLEDWVLRDIGLEHSGLREAAEAAVDGRPRPGRGA